MVPKGNPGYWRAPLFLHLRLPWPRRLRRVAAVMAPVVVLPLAVAAVEVRRAAELPPAADAEAVEAEVVEVLPLLLLHRRSLWRSLTSG